MVHWQDNQGHRLTFVSLETHSEHDDADAVRSLYRQRQSRGRVDGRRHWRKRREGRDVPQTWGDRSAARP
jgi:hypothetical protein